MCLCAPRSSLSILLHSGVINAQLQLVEGDQIHWRCDLVPFYQLQQSIGLLCASRVRPRKHQKLLRKDFARIVTRGMCSGTSDRIALLTSRYISASPHPPASHPSPFTLLFARERRIAPGEKDNNNLSWYTWAMWRSHVAITAADWWGLVSLRRSSHVLLAPEQSSHSLLVPSACVPGCTAKLWSFSSFNYGECGGKVLLGEPYWCSKTNADIRAFLKTTVSALG